MSNFIDLDGLVEKIDTFVERAEIWQLLFDECPLSVAVFNSSYKFYMVNHAFTISTGFSPEEILGKDIKFIIPSRFRRLHKSKEKEFSKNPEKKVNRHGLEPYLLHKDGSEVPIDIDVSFLEYSGKIYYIAFFKCLNT